MDVPPIRVALEFDRADGPISGWLTADTVARRRFSGWVELGHAIEVVLDAGPPQSGIRTHPVDLASPLEEGIR